MAVETKPPLMLVPERVNECQPAESPVGIEVEPATAPREPMFPLAKVCGVERKTRFHEAPGCRPVVAYSTGAFNIGLPTGTSSVKDIVVVVDPMVNVTSLYAELYVEFALAVARITQTPAEVKLTTPVVLPTVH
jgi:hypothetical protein